MPPLLSRKGLALAGTALILVLLALASTQAFRKGSPFSASKVVQKSVGMDLSEAPVMQYAPPPPPATGSLLDARVELAPQKRIHTARISLEVKDFSRFESACRALAERHGYLAELKATTGDDGRKRADLTLRIQAARFDGALAEFKALGTVKHEEVKVEDVTRAYADLEARRANKRAAAVRLREIIATRTGKLSDVIEAEQALSQVTEELESMEAQKRTLDSQIAYSTLHADVSEPPRPARFREPGLWAPLVGALKDGRSGLITSLAFLVEALIVLSPWILLTSLTIWSIRRWRTSRQPAVPAPETMEL